MVRNKIRMVGGLERALLISEFIGDAVFIREPIIDDDVIILYFKLPQDGYGVVKINETYFKNKVVVILGTIGNPYTEDLRVEQRITEYISPYSNENRERGYGRIIDRIKEYFSKPLLP